MTQPSTSKAHMVSWGKDTDADFAFTRCAPPSFTPILCLLLLWLLDALNWAPPDSLATEPNFGPLAHGQ